MRIAEILKAKPDATVVTIGPDAGVRELLALLAEHNVGALIVSADGESLDGIVSERDVVRHLHHDGTVVNNTVRAIMTELVETAEPATSLDDLMEVMTRRRIRHVPVVEDGTPGRDRLDRRRGQAQDEPAGVRARPARLLRAPDLSRCPAPSSPAAPAASGPRSRTGWPRPGTTWCSATSTTTRPPSCASADVETRGATCTLVRADLLTATVSTRCSPRPAR